MANDAKAQQAKTQVFGLVRDKHGKPRFDNIKGIHPQLWAMLTKSEQVEIISKGGYPSE